MHHMSLNTAKPSVDNLDTLLNVMACALRHYLIKAESSNLQIIHNPAVKGVLCLHGKLDFTTGFLNAHIADKSII